MNLVSTTAFCEKRANLLFTKKVLLANSQKKNFHNIMKKKITLM